VRFNGLAVRSVIKEASIVDSESIYKPWFTRLIQEVQTMKKLTKDTTRQEIEQAIKSQINTNPLSRLSPEDYLYLLTYKKSNINFRIR